MSENETNQNPVMDGEELTESKLEGATGGVTSSHLPLRNYKCNKCG